jgi:predicted dehydrogenase
MDYLGQPLGFKIRKILRYLTLYGFNRTYYKALGQLHLRRTYDQIPRQTKTMKPTQIVGLIGCGNYAFTTIANFLTRKYGPIIGGCMDIDINRAASLAEHFRVPVFTTQADDIFANDTIKLVYIASNHATHAEYAIAALERGKHVYIEKPHVVSAEQLARLSETMAGAPGKVFLGFNRPGSRFGRIITSCLDREQGPGMYSFFVVGHDLNPDHWYYDAQEGGRILGNVCHWTDFILRLAGHNAIPITITPTRAEKTDTDIAVTYTFGDGTIAVLTFSAKGHTFEGVKERFNAHKGNCLITMRDFKTLRIDIGSRRERWYNLHLDHGHRHNIIAAADNVLHDLPYDRRTQFEHLRNTARLFLKTKEALERNQQLTLTDHAHTNVCR